MFMVQVGVEASSVYSTGESQSWPMPDSSLMLAHEAVVDMQQKVDGRGSRGGYGSLSLQLQVCPDELECAKWFTREEVKAAYERTLADPFLKV